MASINSVNPLFGGAETTSIAAGGTATTDTFTMNSSAPALRARFKIKANNDGTPASGDEVEVFLLQAGDPDADATEDFSSSSDTQAQLVTVLNTNDSDPAVRDVVLDGPFDSSCKLYCKNTSGGRSITVSAVIEELLQ
jgi:hypothetical protein